MTTFAGGSFVGALITISVLSLTALRTEPVFVYGTLTQPVFRTYACLCFVGATPAQLPGFEKAGRTIHKTNHSVVPGQLITVSKQELRLLDRYEGVPDRYRRITVRLRDGTTAEVYQRVTDG